MTTIIKKNHHNFLFSIVPDKNRNRKFSHTHTREIIGKGHDNKNGKHFDCMSSQKSKVKSTNNVFTRDEHIF